MTLPNKLTLVRLFFIPIMVVIYYIKPLQNVIFFNMSYSNFINVIIFIVASLTDMLDGKIARKYNLVTTFGKFADPLADKILVFSAMLILMAQGALDMWIVTVIMAREFIVSGIRLVAVEHGDVIAASNLGKYKTAVTMVALAILFFFQINNIVFLIGEIGMYLAAFLTVLSGVDYFWKNRKAILKSV